MIKLFNELYYVDIEKFNDYVTIPSVDIPGTTGTTEQSISMVKFEIVKAMIEVLLTENGQPIDEKLAMKGESISIPFKLAFNTLHKIKIINSI